jgi:hypothetical protein
MMSDSTHTNEQIPSRREMLQRRAYIVLLWMLVAALFVGLVSCAPGTKENGQGVTVGDATSATQKPLRLILTGTAAQDSVANIADFHVDQVLRQVFDSVDGVDYLTVNLRDSIALAKDPTGKKGIPLAELTKALDLDGGINVAIARFGNVLALDFAVTDARTGKSRYRDFVFQQIRYRDTAGTMLIGPALYDALRTGVGRFVGRRHERTSVAASTPIVLSSIVIPSDPRLREISKSRETTSRSILTALFDYAGTHFPELVLFDALSRDRLYETIRIGAVANYLAPKAGEQRALFNVGIDRYLLGSIDPIGADSLRMRLEIRSIVKPPRDTVEFAREMVQPIAAFSSGAFEEDVILAMLDLAEPLFREVKDSVTARYERGRAERIAGARRPAAGGKSE